MHCRLEHSNPEYRLLIGALASNAGAVRAVSHIAHDHSSYRDETAKRVVDHVHAVSEFLLQSLLEQLRLMWIFDR